VKHRDCTQNTQPGFECNCLWVLKKPLHRNGFSSVSMPSPVFLSPVD
jgi:hypothetical protein